MQRPSPGVPCASAIAAMYRAATGDPPTTHAQNRAGVAVPDHADRHVVERSSQPLSNEDGAVPLDEFSSPQWKDLGQQAVGRVQTGDLGEDALRTARHPPGRDVESGAVPRADQTALSVDRSVGEIGAQVPTAPGEGKQLAVRISNRVRPGTADHAWNQLSSGSHFVLAPSSPSIQ